MNVQYSLGLFRKINWIVVYLFCGFPRHLGGCELRKTHVPMLMPAAFTATQLIFLQSSVKKVFPLGSLCFNAQTTT
jgi:hypothetical protein